MSTSKLPVATSRDGHRDRVRQRIAKGTLDQFAPHEIIEYLLFCVIPRKDTKPIAYDLLKRFGSLAGVLEAHPEELQTVHGISENAALYIASILPVHRAYIQDKWGDKPILDRASLASEYCISLFTGRTKECFFMLCLDMRNRLTNTVMVCEGTIDELPVYPREIAQIALRNHATQLVLTHNHPSGNCNPSLADIEATQRIMQAMAAINVDVMDHIVVAGHQFCSMASAQLIPPPGHSSIDGMGMFRQSWRQSPDLSELRASVASWSGIEAQDLSRATQQKHFE